VRLVLDTNVLVSALLRAPGPCGRLVDLLLDGAIEACVDERILGEYQEVLVRPAFRFALPDIETILEFFRHIAIPVVALPLDVALPDPDDLPFLEVAASAQAILVTGNRRRFPKNAIGSVVVVSPTEYLKALQRTP